MWQRVTLEDSFLSNNNYLWSSKTGQDHTQDIAVSHYWVASRAKERDVTDWGKKEEHTYYSGAQL